MTAAAAAEQHQRIRAMYKVVGPDLLERSPGSPAPDPKQKNTKQAETSRPTAAEGDRTLFGAVQRSTQAPGGEPVANMRVGRFLAEAEEQLPPVQMAIAGDLLRVLAPAEMARTRHRIERLKGACWMSVDPETADSRIRISRVRIPATAARRR